MDELNYNIKNDGFSDEELSNNVIESDGLSNEELSDNDIENDRLLDEELSDNDIEDSTEDANCNVPNDVSNYIQRIPYSIYCAKYVYTIVKMFSK